MKNIFTVANIIFITLLSYLGVSGFYQALTSTQGPAHPDEFREISQSVSQEKNVTHPLSYYQKVNDRNLFKTGKAPEIKSESQVVDTGKIGLTDLNLKLWGTVTGDDVSAYAVIEDTKARKQNLYRTGDAIQSAVVKLILREEVILNVGGKDEKLEIEKVTASKAGRKSYTPGRVGAAARPTRAQKITLRRSQIEDAMENINDLMGQIKIRPHFENGVPSGLAVSSIKSKSIFRKMGLRNGDVITGVDGQQIETVDDALKLYENMMSTSSVAVQLKRRGKEKNIQYNIK